jgi:hypothetical protein
MALSGHAARASSRLGALHPVMRVEFLRQDPTAIANNQARPVGRTEPRMKAVRVAATGVRADGIVHGEDGWPAGTNSGRVKVVL